MIAFHMRTFNFEMLYSILRLGLSLTAGKARLL
jgi:hypothetical protein